MTFWVHSEEREENTRQGKVKAEKIKFQGLHRYFSTESLHARWSVPVKSPGGKGDVAVGLFKVFYVKVGG